MRRCQILLASAKGKRASQIGSELGCDTDTALNAINAFKRRGWLLWWLAPTWHIRSAGLRRGGARSCGRCCTRARASLGDSEHWTLEMAAEVSLAQGLMSHRVSREAVRTALLRLGVRWKRAKKWISSPDPAYERKKGVATD